MPDAITLSQAPTITIRPWIDPVVDEHGYDPRSRYVETFWLGVLGPTATWMVRRLAAGLDQHPQGYEADLVVLAKEMGLGFETGRITPFTRGLHRCVMFGLAHAIPGGLAVRRRVPAVAHRHLKRMPESVRAAHEAWQTRSVTLDELTRAHQLAMAMLDVGDAADTVEHQLLALGVTEVTAAEVADNVARLQPDDKVR
jgi:hypothetical protein